MTFAYIGIGSNLGIRENNIHAAIDLLGKNVNIIQISSFIETTPMYYLEQGSFLNGAIKIETNLNPEELLKALQCIEKTMGREKLIDKGPRIIDLDILLYGNKIIKTKDLTIPHPLIRERFFVLKPLAEIAPNLVHPVLKKNIKGLLKELISVLPQFKK